MTLNRIPILLLVGIIRIYQQVFSFDTGIIGSIVPKRARVCIFYPSCSEYAILAIKKFGILSGFRMALRRVISCRPSHGPTVDFP